MTEAATILWCLDTCPEDEVVFPKLHDKLSVYIARSRNEVAKLLFEFPKIRLVLISVGPSNLKGLMVNLREMQDRYRYVSFVTTIEERIDKDTVGKLIISLLGLDSPRRRATDLGRQQASYESHPEAYDVNGNMVRHESSPYLAPGLRRDPSFSHAARLTPRQRDVLTLIMQGKSNKQIARILDLTEGTVKIHCMAIFRQLGVTNRTQAALVGESCLA